VKLKLRVHSEFELKKKKIKTTETVNCMIFMEKKRKYRATKKRRPEELGKRVFTNSNMGLGPTFVWRSMMPVTKEQYIARMRVGVRSRTIELI
jgi:hypothetical protein